MPTQRHSLPVVDRGAAEPGAGKGGGERSAARAARAGAGGWEAFTDGGTAPRWVIAARVVMVLALAATIPTILAVEHGNRLLWTVCIASLPFFWLTFGYHLWRRICPLAVAAQAGRLLGRPGTRKMGDWMGRHYILVQLALMLVGLSLRLVITNGDAVGVSVFLGVVLVAAVVVSLVYGGKTWCNFVCPVGLVEKIHTEPARSSSGLGASISSQCSPCVACKRHCPDIDLEQGYWKESTERARRIAYFAWPGIVVGFYAYFYLATGRWSYYFSGEWAYERGSLALAPGLYLAPELPRLVAAPLTLLAFGAGSFLALHLVETFALALDRAPGAASPEQRQQRAARVRHGMLAFAGLLAFNAFYWFAGQPTLRTLPPWVVTGWGVLVVFSSTAIFMRRISRREEQHVQEKFAQKILKKWEWGDAPPSDDLKDIYLVHTERTRQREARLRAYKETVREMVADGLVTRGELAILDSLRAQLGIGDKDHQKIVGELTAEERQLFDPAFRGSVEQRLAREAYRKDLERLVVEAARLGRAPSDASLAALRGERGVSEQDQAAQLAEILAPGGPIAAMYGAELAQVERLVAASEASLASEADGSTGSASLALLRHLAERRAHDHAIHAAGVLSVLSGRPEVAALHAHAASRGRLNASELAALDGVDDGLRAPLVGLAQRLARDERSPLDLGRLLAIAGDASYHLRAAIAILLSRFDGDEARDALRAMLDDAHAIVREAAVRSMSARSRLTRELMAKILADPSPVVRHAAVRAVSGRTSSPELPALDPALLAQTVNGVGQAGVFATLDASAAMSSLTTIEKMMLVRQVPMFSQLAPQDLEELAEIVEEANLEAATMLFREGDAGDAVYIVVKGKVEVFLGGGDRTERTLSELGPGACIGEMAVLDREPRSASVRTLARTRALRIPGEGFRRVMSQRPEMSEAIVAELVRRMRELNQQIGRAR